MTALRLWPLTLVTPEQLAETQPRFVGRLFCSADSVIVGVVESSESALTSDRTFIFTDYIVRIKEVFKASETARSAVGQSVVVTRQGGTLVLDGKSTQAIDRAAPPLAIGQELLLFLEYLPDTQTFSAATGDSAFAFTGERFAPLDASTDTRHSLDSRSVILDLRQAPALCG